MTSQILLLSTCGTSSLTNNADENTRSWLNKIANKKDLPKTESERLQKHAAHRKQQLLDAKITERRRLSAELNGIAAVLERWAPSRIQHFLIQTDTAAGKACAKIVQAVLEKDGQPVQIIEAPGLRTDDFPSFREALADVTKQLEELLPGHREQGWTVLFNLTGGFKSVNAYLQALGMLYADRCVFLFEGAPMLMEIPRLPIKLVEKDEIQKHLTVFRKLEHGYSVAESEAAGIPDALLLSDDGQVTASVWGDVVWSRVRKELLKERLLEPLSPKLAISNAVRKAFDKLEDKRRVEVNDALDALSAHLDLGKELPKSNTLRELKGNPVPPATHELYLWSDGSAGRLFGHFDEDHFIADSLGPHV
ncbi:MAG: putative CRISPR-associated protein [Acidobacteriia bacterium]|nr:putative CRISPR-associated protein [Methyloceanibacter sp.]MBX5473097.1 putative CRISPR-associated protein [Acetobacteraceae bacterium]MCL6490835.1 putative CRISPR-associated protein [Terriglobia bacterium]